MAKSETKHIEGNRDEIIKVLSSVSKSMVEHIQNHSESRFSLWLKVLNHSDLTTPGKRCGPEQGIENNLLYYLSLDEMKKMEGEGTKFETAKQSNISLPKGVYEEFGISRTKGPFPSKAMLVNDSLSYFTKEYTTIILHKLNKRCPWESDKDYQISQGAFTPIEVHIGDHGIGTGDDIEFSKLRKSVFLNDVIYVLIEHMPNDGCLTYFMFEKNPRFFQILGKKDEAWDAYLEEWQRKAEELRKSNAEESLVLAHQRTLQDEWKCLLASEMMNFVHDTTNVECPFTRIKADFDKVPMLFIASHIKRYADSDIHEKYDINNGLLLCANADALFDKYMVTVSEDKELLFSCLLDEELKNDLSLNHSILKYILNEKRMKYMEEHRAMFLEKEIERRERFGISDTNSFVQAAPKPYEVPEAECSMPMAAEGFFIPLKGQDVSTSRLPNSIVLIGCYKSIRHLKWIRDVLLYNVRLGKRKGAVDSMPEEVRNADILILYDINHYDRYQVYRIAPKAIMTKAQLDELGYPKANSEEYFVYQLVKELTGKYDVNTLINRAKERNASFTNGMPIYVINNQKN